MVQFKFEFEALVLAQRDADQSRSAALRAEMGPKRNCAGKCVGVFVICNGLLRSDYSDQMFFDQIVEAATADENVKREAIDTAAIST